MGKKRGDTYLCTVPVQCMGLPHRSVLEQSQKHLQPLPSSNQWSALPENLSKCIRSDAWVDFLQSASFKPLGTKEESDEKKASLFLVWVDVQKLQDMEHLVLDFTSLRCEFVLESSSQDYDCSFPPMAIRLVRQGLIAHPLSGMADWPAESVWNGSKTQIWT